MGVPESCFALILAIILAFFAWHIANAIRNKRKISNFNEKIKFRHKLTNYEIFWYVVSTLNFLIYILRYIKEKELSFLLLALIWFVITVLFSVDAVIGRYAYLTSKGLLRLDSWGGNVYSNYKCRFRIDDEILEIYYRKGVKPMKFRISENKDELIKMLTDNFEPYIQENKK